jgi:hypothetical protein
MPDKIPNEDVINKDCYIDGYQKFACNENTYNALAGGLCATIIFMTIYGIVNAAKGKDFLGSGPFLIWQ